MVTDAPFKLYITVTLCNASLKYPIIPPSSLRNLALSNVDKGRFQSGFKTYFDLVYWRNCICNMLVTVQADLWSDGNAFSTRLGDISTPRSLVLTGFYIWNVLTIQLKAINSGLKVRLFKSLRVFHESCNVKDSSTATHLCCPSMILAIRIYNSSRNRGKRKSKQVLSLIRRVST